MKDKLTHILFRKKFSLPKAGLLDEAARRFSLTERVIFYTLAGILALVSFIALAKVSQSFMVEVPARGGTLTEGVIGLPRFANPLLAISDADRDLTALIYSGLLKATPTGELVPDLAESYNISTDGLSYTFILKDNIVFQDGTPVTADDVIFTIEKAQDPSLKSPKRPNWEGVQIEKVSDKEVKLTLRQPYSPFLENATLGILPKHIWENVGAEEFPFSEFNIEPVGSGPYKLRSVSRNASGIPLSYRLETFDEYASDRPLITYIVLRFFQNQNDLLAAYKNGNIGSMASISPAQAAALKEDGGRVERTPLPRVFAVFFNQSRAPVLANKEVRQALELATDKQAIVEEVLHGYGIAIDSPLPPSLVSVGVENFARESGDERVATAKKILEKATWKYNETKRVYEKKGKTSTAEFAFSISTSNAPELKASAEMLRQMWERIGARVDVKIFDIGELNQSVIRTRKYDALLFGEIIGRDLDLFAFWHSSQRNDPGLNVALYTNSKADKLLEDARTLPDAEKRLVKYKAFIAEIKNDVPAIFLYSPDFLYVVPDSLRGLGLSHITIPAERFLDISEWYVETEKVWKVFAP